MGKLIAELRRRHVFRATGLYVGIAWIVLQGADVMLPAFEAPNWVFRTLVIVAIAGVPLTAVLAWIYEYTERGIKRQEVAEAEHVPHMLGRQMDFIVIGVLAIALAFSLYLNVRKEPLPPGAMEPVSILVADFDNQTGDPVFDGTLELALTIGLERAPFITAYHRTLAIKLARRLKDDTEDLDMEASRLVSMHETIKYVVAGTIRPEGAAYALSISLLTPDDGEVIAEESASAQNKSEIFAAVGSLAGHIRTALGDQSIDSIEHLSSETLRAAAIDVVSDFVKAKALAQEQRFDEALELYQGVIDADPNFGRGLTAYSLTLHSLGRVEEAEAIWQKAMFSMDTMTERERLRIMGAYYAFVQDNYERSKESYDRLVELYPADSHAHHSLAIMHFAELEFEQAQEKGSRIVEIYPNNAEYRENLALYAMYAGDFETASAESEETLALDATRYLAWLPRAMARASIEDFEGARAAYEEMSTMGDRGRSLANLGIADLEMLRGDYSSAVVTLLAGIEHDEAISNSSYPAMGKSIESIENRSSVAAKRSMLSAALVATGQTEEANVILQSILQHSDAGQAVPTALVSLQLGDTAIAADLAETLGSRLQPDSRAYALMIEGLLASAAGEHATAIAKLNTALETFDLWLIHFQLGIVYLEAGRVAEALSHFDVCETRISETTSLFMNDYPTWRYSVLLKYWKARAHEAIDMRAPAVEGYESFLALRPDLSDDPLAADAHRRLMAITGE